MIMCVGIETRVYVRIEKLFKMKDKAMSHA